MSGVPQAQQSAESITRVREHMIQIGLQFVRPQLSVFSPLSSASCLPRSCLALPVERRVLVCLTLSYSISNHYRILHV